MRHDWFDYNTDLLMQVRAWEVPGTGAVKMLDPTASSVTLIVQSTSTWHAGQNRSRSRQDRDVNGHPFSSQLTDIEDPPTPPATAISGNYQGQQNGSNSQVSSWQSALRDICNFVFRGFIKKDSLCL